MATPCSKVLLFFRRACSVVVENVKTPPAAKSMMRKVAETSGTNVNNSNVVKVGGTLPEVGGPGVTKDVFWMKDPKTGIWLPETQFNQVDAVEFPEKMLSKPSSS